MSIGLAVALRLLILAADTISPTQGAHPIDPHQRYDEARQLAQQARYVEAARAYREVADAEAAPIELRAQALYVCGLMLQNARKYEDASAAYRDVQRRFPRTQFARRAELMAEALEEGGAEHWLEFRHRQDAASDELLAAEALAERSARAARAGYERAAALLADLLRDFPAHPQAPSIAVSLGNAHMALRDFAAARADYERAIALSRSQSAGSVRPASVVDSIAVDAEQRLKEAILGLRRQRITHMAWAILGAIGVGVVLLRPWRAIDGAMVRLAAGLTIATLVLAVLASAGSYIVRTYLDPNSPIEMEAAGLLVAVPGVTGEIVALALVAGLRGRRGAPTASIAAGLAAIAALAVATCVIDAYALFPVLDSLL